MGIDYPTNNAALINAFKRYLGRSRTTEGDKSAGKATENRGQKKPTEGQGTQGKK